MVQEVAETYCVYRNEVHHSAAERTQVLQDVAADPTLPRTKDVRCAMCKHPEAVFFQVSFRFYLLCQGCIRNHIVFLIFIE
ncbi:DNA-directed RNA polymerases II, IV and V subunit 9A [Linum perenne]